MEISAIYNPAATESKWYQYWLDQGFFHSEPDERPKYAMVIPPPNVTGVLHVGHMLNNTIQDVLVRRARMQGKNACWVPGTDHASIATEAKVVAWLKKQGIDKEDLSREEFLRYAWQWKEKHGGIILQQLKRLGASCDWQRTCFTMDPAMSRAVINTFVYLYNQGLIYRDVRMINWDPAGCTALSDEEVIHREVREKLYYLRYYLQKDDRPSADYLTIATTRPETIMADAALCVHPADPRFTRFIGRKVYIPLIDKPIPVIADDYVSMDFGTGCLKITPAHDINDYRIGQRYKLPVIDILDKHGRLNHEARILVGMDRFEARKAIVKQLDEAGYLVKAEDYTTQVGFSERTNTVIEPRLSMQWFVKMGLMAQKSLNYVLSGDIKLIPDKYKNTYRHWMETARDWCISRQLWWGQQIPAYYLPDGGIVVAATAEEALSLARKTNPACQASDLRQDPDVLDTWFSSWLWPISVFDPDKPGFPDRRPNKDLAYYFPTDDLVTAPDILFFWVARMVMAADAFCGAKPFSHVYFTGTVRDKLGRKMSKSLGNSPDPIALIDTYGSDGVRMGLLLCTAAGNDILFDESQVEQGRNFCNKIWNAYRLIQMIKVDPDAEPSPVCRTAVAWFDSLINKTIEETEDLFSKFRLSEALMLLYKCFWDDFCAYYLELIKPRANQALDGITLKATLGFFDVLLRMLHPFMPFITEELWQHLASRRAGESIMVSRLPRAGAYDKEILAHFEFFKGIVVAVRSMRQSKQIAPKLPLELFVHGDFPARIDAILKKSCNISQIHVVDHEVQEKDLYTFMVATTEFSIPIGALLDKEEENRKIAEELAYLHKFLAGVEKKLSNKNFVERAPAQIVALEKKKQQDALSKIAVLEDKLEAME